MRRERGGGSALESERGRRHARRSGVGCVRGAGTKRAHREKRKKERKNKRQRRRQRWVDNEQSVGEWRSRGERERSKGPTLCVNEGVCKGLALWGEKKRENGRNESYTRRQERLSGVGSQRRGPEKDTGKRTEKKAKPNKSGERQRKAVRQGEGGCGLGVSVECSNHFQERGAGWEK